MSKITTAVCRESHFLFMMRCSQPFSPLLAPSFVKVRAGKSIVWFMFAKTGLSAKKKQNAATTRMGRARAPVSVGNGAVSVCGREALKRQSREH